MITWDELNQRLGQFTAEQRNEWCGVPLPIPGFRLVVEDRNPWSPMVEQLQAAADKGTTPDPDARVCTSEDAAWVPVNSWWSRRQRRTVGICRHAETGKYTTFGDSYDYARKGTLLFDTLRASHVWPLDAEIKAMETLSEHLRARPHLFDAYICTGTFLETSKRSGLTYIFRRCRPTLVYNAERQRFICALCLHPIAYYADTHAGSMVPTDDIIAHLLLMRADEPLLWRRANQHPVDRPEAGI